MQMQLRYLWLYGECNLWFLLLRKRFEIFTAESRGAQKWGHHADVSRRRDGAYKEIEIKQSSQGKIPSSAPSSLHLFLHYVLSDGVLPELRTPQMKSLSSSVAVRVTGGVLF